MNEAGLLSVKDQSLTTEKLPAVSYAIDLAPFPGLSIGPTDDCVYLNVATCPACASGMIAQGEGCFCPSCGLGGGGWE